MMAKLYLLGIFNLHQASKCIQNRRRNTALEPTTSTFPPASMHIARNKVVPADTELDDLSNMHVEIAEDLRREPMKKACTIISDHYIHVG